MKKPKIILNFIAIITLLLLLGVYFWHPLLNLFSNLPRFKQFVLNFGILAPIILIIIVALQVLIAPIPGQAAGLVSGLIFGPILGTIYSMIGLIIGSYLAFVLARKFGRPFVEKFVNQETLKKFDNFSNEKGLFTFFMIYLLPALPDDAICYIAGLTKIRIRSLVLVSTIGRFPGFLVLNLIGAGLASQNSKFAIILFITFMAISILLYLYKDKIEKSMLEIIKKFNRKV